MGTELHVNAQNVKLQEENRILRAGIKAVRELIDDSIGVSGLHLNGDIAYWQELQRGDYLEDWLLAFNAAEDII